MLFPKENGRPFWAIALLFLAKVGLGATSPTAAVTPPRLSGPIVFETEIKRTSEPLSLFNVLPPPLPLEEVKRLEKKNGRPAWRPAVGGHPASLSGRRTSPTTPTLSAAKRRSRRRAFLPKRRPKITPPPYRPRYTDTLIMTNGEPLRCRIIAEKASALRVELANGVIVDFPRRRISRFSYGRRPR